MRGGGSGFIPPPARIVELPMTPQPIRYDPSLETIEPDEGETIENLRGSFREILETTSADYGRAVRSVHAKGHGLVHGTLTIAGGLPPELAQGIFTSPGEHPVILRFSTAPGDILDDSVSSPRGLSIKVLGVEGERLEGSSGDTTQDFLMVNGPVFGARKSADFAKNLKLLAKTTDRAEGAKKLLSAALRAVETGLETVGLESSLVKQLGGAPEVHPLGETYFTQTPYRYGDHVVKLSVAPVSPALVDVTGDIVDTSGRPDALREEIGRRMVAKGGTWEVRVQLCTDPEATPIEDPTVEWDEEASPFRTVATITVDPQVSWTPGESDNAEDRLAFSPWHGVQAHRPLGQINRARKPMYDFSRDFRGDFNGCPVHEPTATA